ncbi:hypothetical protein KIL84_015304, partial [Mauremys mutica]
KKFLLCNLCISSRIPTHPKRYKERLSKHSGLNLGFSEHWCSGRLLHYTKRLSGVSVIHYIGAYRNCIILYRFLFVVALDIYRIYTHIHGSFCIKNHLAHCSTHWTLLYVSFIFRWSLSLGIKDQEDILPAAGTQPG